MLIRSAGTKTGKVGGGSERMGGGGKAGKWSIRKRDRVLDAGREG